LVVIFEHIIISCHFFLLVILQVITIITNFACVIDIWPAVSLYQGVATTNSPAEPFVIRIKLKGVGSATLVTLRVYTRTTKPTAAVVICEACIVNGYLLSKQFDEGARLKTTPSDIMLIFLISGAVKKQHQCCKTSVRCSIHVRIL